MMVETTANWNGVQYTHGPEQNRQHTVSAYVRKVNDEDEAQDMLWLILYTQFGTLNPRLNGRNLRWISLSMQELFAIRLAPVDEQPEIIM